MHPKILILAGTHEARLLANKLVRDGYDVTSSFAGVTENPTLPDGKIRVGHFGGVSGLQAYMAAESIDVLVDATHPFAAVMSTHAAQAAAQAATHIVRLERPCWSALPQDRWMDVHDTEAALSALPGNARVMLTIGRKEAAIFSSRADISGVARMIEPQPEFQSEKWHIILQRPPFNLSDEMDLFRQHSISHLVTKNAGGRETAAKLEAARTLGLPVVMIARPFKPKVTTFTSIDAIAAAIASR